MEAAAGPAASHPTFDAAFLHFNTFVAELAADSRPADSGGTLPEPVTQRQSQLQEAVDSATCHLTLLLLPVA